MACILSSNLRISAFVRSSAMCKLLRCWTSSCTFASTTFKNTTSTLLEADFTRSCPAFFKSFLEAFTILTPRIFASLAVRPGFTSSSLIVLLPFSNQRKDQPVSKTQHLPVKLLDFSMYVKEHVLLPVCGNFSREKFLAVPTLLIVHRQFFVSHP